MIETLAPIRLGDDATLASLIGGAWSIAMLLPTLAVAVRRLRDTGRCWTSLFFALIAVVGVVLLAAQLARPAPDEPAGRPRPQDAR